MVWNKQRARKRAEVSIGWRDFLYNVLFCLGYIGCLVVSSKSALIGSHSSVSRLLSLSNYTSLGLFYFVWPHFSLLVLARLYY